MNKTLLTTVLVGGALMLGGGAALASTTSPVAAASVTKTEAKYGATTYYTVPSSFKGTWYSYNKKSKKYTTLKVSSHKIGNQILLNRKASYQPKGGGLPGKAETKATKNFFTVNKVKVKGVTYLGLYGFSQTAGSSVYYGTFTPSVNGKKTTVLAQATGAGKWTTKTYYHTKAQAKHLASKHYTQLNYLK